MYNSYVNGCNTGCYNGVGLRGFGLGFNRCSTPCPGKIKYKSIK